MPPDSSKLSPKSADAAPAHPRARARRLPRAVQRLINQKAHAELAEHCRRMAAMMTNEVAKRIAAGESATDIAHELRANDEKSGP